MPSYGLSYRTSKSDICFTSVIVALHATSCHVGLYHNDPDFLPRQIKSVCTLKNSTRELCVYWKIPHALTFRDLSRGHYHLNYLKVGVKLRYWSWFIETSFKLNSMHDKINLTTTYRLTYVYHNTICTIELKIMPVLSHKSYWIQVCIHKLEAAGEIWWRQISAFVSQITDNSTVCWTAWSG